ncbi:MAG: PLP-dependent transferase, partial [Gammaproteobacteria bacterium]|nr:PLP-dependent transferase [Gammaproteobacteria bacterium]
MSKPSELIGWNDYSYSYGDREIRTINPSIQSGSTVLFESYEDMQLHDKGQYPGVTYGTGGLSTQKSFEEAICKLENGHISRAFPSGINAIICTLMAFTRSGDEVLITDNVYGPTARFCHKVLAKYNIK